MKQQPKEDAQKVMRQIKSLADYVSILDDVANHRLAQIKQIAKDYLAKSKP